MSALAAEVRPAPPRVPVSDAAPSQRSETSSSSSSSRTSSSRSSSHTAAVAAAVSVPEAPASVLQRAVAEAAAFSSGQMGFGSAVPESDNRELQSHDLRLSASEAWQEDGLEQNTASTSSSTSMDEAVSAVDSAQGQDLAARSSTQAGPAAHPDVIGCTGSEPSAQGAMSRLSQFMRRPSTRD
uniref:Uncharacterized protein n=1 Tax=Chlamydomonas chlamydogama TaxID=225041 RepID=A0A7S2QUE0_9CHLO|mmetsp:Transcript_602/g.1392  ORF Transcript_602/g.1392 Transcript_602/m.1392 type:complete len:183 (+) Transcript_602:2-550(+)